LDFCPAVKQFGPNWCKSKKPTGLNRWAFGFPPSAELKPNVKHTSKVNSTVSAFKLPSRSPQAEKNAQAQQARR
jgi:hypothetical protein